MGGHGQLEFTPANWSLAQGSEQFPQGTSPGGLTNGPTGVERSLDGFTTAANAGDPAIDSQHQLDYENRQLKYDDAQNKFATNEQNAEQQMQGVEQQSEDQMAQMIPQLVSGLAQSVGGLLGGLVSPLAQIPQQLMQAGTQALQQGMIAMQSAESEALTDEQLLGEEGLTDPLTEDTGLGGAESGSAGSAGTGGTEPTSTLSAPVSGTTFPSSAPTLKGAVASTSTVPHSSMMGGMGGMPMIPPGAMGGANQQQDQKPDTKRVTAPPVKNGSPVQGRLTAPLAPPVTRLIEGRPVATRRSNTTETEEAKAEESRPS